MDRFPRRIVCLTEEHTEILYLLGAEERIVGISGFTVRPPRARKEKPKVSAYLSADVPKIEALAPDLILGFSDLQADIARELIRRGHNVVITNQRSVDEILRTIVMVGALVGLGDEADLLATSLAARLERVRRAVPARGARPRVYFEEWPDPTISGIRWVSELIEIAGGDDIFPELRDASLGKDRIVRDEDVLARDPDIILASWCGKKAKLDQIAKRFAATSAARRGHLYEIKSAMILQPGPAALTDGLDAIVDCLSRL